MIEREELKSTSECLEEKFVAMSKEDVQATVETAMKENSKGLLCAIGEIAEIMGGY